MTFLEKIENAGKEIDKNIKRGGPSHIFLLQEEDTENNSKEIDENQKVINEKRTT